MAESLPTEKQVYDPQLALRQRIAGILDRPSIYMGGPSKQNLKRADDIIAAIREDARLLQAINAGDVPVTRQADITDVRPLDLEQAKRAVAHVIEEERRSEVLLPPTRG